MQNRTLHLILPVLTFIFAPAMPSVGAQHKPSHPSHTQAVRSASNSGQDPNAAVPGAGTKLGDARVAGVRVKGLEPAQARRKLVQALSAKLHTGVRVTDGIKSVLIARKDLGIVLDDEGMIGQAKQGVKAVGLKLRVDRKVFQMALRRLAPKFHYTGQNAHPVLQRGHIRLVGGQAERSVDIGKSAQILADRIETRPSLSTLSLVMQQSPPRISAGTLKGVTGKLSRFETRFQASHTKRSHNIRAAAKRIDGVVLLPGQVFSLNKTVGERTHEHGFLTAPVFENAKKVEGIGGGVSQVAGTLFNAALLAGLPIVEYGTHTKPVPYLPIARDATVAWNHIDLRFKNNTQAPLYIDYKVVGNRCMATLYGASDPGLQVRLETASKKLGPHRISAELYRVIKKRGKLIRTEKVGRSEYNWKPDQNEE
jgi:vancomycin resistance protein YoaR